MNNLFRLDGRTALVTGGSKGLGLAMAKLFAAAGADILICSRHEDELKTAAVEIEKMGEIGKVGEGQVKTFVADLTCRDQQLGLANFAKQTFNTIDILINNAGTNEPQTLEETTEETWDKIVELNLSSCMFLARELVAPMKQQKWGRMIYLSSIMGMASNPARGAYSATKAALIGMVRAHALELGPYNITVNCIAPGPIMTDLPMNLLNDEQKAAFAARPALLRWGQPEEIAGPALLLASEAGSYITGETLLVDGGTLCRTFG